MFTEADQLIILTDNLGGAFRKIESERRLVSPEVIDIKNELLGKVLWGSPDNPADARIDKTVLVMQL